MTRPNRISQNTGSLYFAQFIQYLIPLAVLPYLSRVLGPEVFGLVIFSQAYAYFLSVFIEYGFNLSGTRSIAIVKNQSGLRAHKALGITGAQLILAIIIFPTALIAGVFVPFFGDNLVYLWFSAILAVTLGLRNYWYFWGTERLVLPSMVVIGSGLLYAVGIIFLVESPSDGWKVLALQVVASVFAYTILYNMMFRETGTSNFSIKEVRTAFSEGWELFVSGLAVSLYSRANIFLLGFFAGISQVGFFGASDKVIRAVNRLSYPIGKVFFPKIIQAMDEDKPDLFQQMFRRLFWSLTTAGILVTAGLYASAPWLIPFLFGSEFAEAVSVFRIFVFALPLLIIGYLLGDHWVIPKGRDVLFRKVTLAAGLFSVISLIILAMQFGVYGAAVSVILTEFVAIAGFWILLKNDRPKLFG